MILLCLLLSAEPTTEESALLARMAEHKYVIARDEAQALLKKTPDS